MKKIIFLSILFLPVLLHAQFEELLKKTKTPELLEDKNVTTSVTDAYPVAFWLGELGDWIDPVEMQDYSFDLTPGYYRYTIQSYCLKAGSNGPTRGSGYLIAPLKGKRADVVENILKRSADHPEIEQHDIQLLIWAIIYNTKFTDLESGLQMRVRPLLTEAEIADLSLDIKNIPLDLLPDELKQTAGFYKDLRSKLTNPASSFEDVERMAVLPGDPPSSLLVKEVAPGNWAYAGSGYYIRIMPEVYSRSVLEVYRPAVVNVQRDNLNRITSFEQDGSRVDITYQGDAGNDVLSVSGKFYPVYRFKSIKFTGTNSGEEYLIENTGWMIRGDGKALSGSPQFKNYPQDPTLAEYKTRLDAANEYFKMMAKYKKDFTGRPGKGSETDVADEFDADKHMHDGMKAALNPQDMKGKQSWLRKHFGFVMDWWNGSSDALSGNEGNNTNDRKKFGPEHNAGAPGNTGAQRIGVSKRKSPR